MARVTVELPGMLAALLDQGHTLELEADTLGDLFRTLRGEHPELGLHLFDEESGVRQHVLIFHNEENTRWREDPGTVLADGDRITILQAVSGG